ncbi:Tetratricopeptide repeat-containing protein [Amycolatopsis arida]|uniref:Tetratricopeptide repeat-containing protein n=1 Tax=Amycolatopsis arida TaxID=587909 RepID=A0A1I5PZS5_9PSEU|nr:tetratricopeptide repeat protein [Amycolatopsis arida]TDX98663.1 tetratricopeptide repeat protein [Amycolatopsis arida]SFP39429.1 Tetratricopeptide repeat-containing protein [Amycolatopsis arida]
MTEQEPDTGEDRLRAFRRAEELVRRRPLDALKALEPVLAAEPDKPSVQLLAGRAYFHSAQLRQAETALSRVVELDPADHYARFVLGRTLQRLGRLVEALGQLRMASAMNPVPEYQDAIGEVRARLALGSS